MSVVDLYRLYRHVDYETYESMGIVSFSDLVCAGMKEKERKILPVPLRKYTSFFDSDSSSGASRLERITNACGEYYHEKVTNGKRKRQSAIQKSCFVCRHRWSRLPADERATMKKYQYTYTTFCCIACKTPLCSSCSIKEGHELTCVDEHFLSGNAAVRCNGSLKGRVNLSER